MARRLIVLTRFCPPCGGGAELATHIVIERILVRLFDQVHIVTGHTCPQRGETQQVRITRFPAFAGSKPEIVLKTMRARDKLLKLLEGYDTVYIPSNALLFIAYFLRRWGYRGRVILHLHDYQAVSYSSALFYNTPPGPYTDYLVERRDYGRRIAALTVMGLQPVQKLYNKGFCSADVAITVSNRQRTLIRKYSGCWPSEVKTIYNPLPPELRSHTPSAKPSNEQQKKPVIIYTGGPRLTKGYPVVLRLLLELAKRWSKPQAEIILLQLTTREKKRLERLARKTRLKITLLPRLPRRELYKLYQAPQSILLHPSLHEEPLPYSIVEAVMLGAKPLASRLGGVPELLEATPLEKYLHNPGDTRQILDQLEEALLQDMGIHLKEVEKTRKTIIKKIDYPSVEDKIEKIFI